MKEYKIAVIWPPSIYSKQERTICVTAAPIDMNMAKYCDCLRAVFGNQSIIEFEVVEKTQTN